MLAYAALEELVPVYPVYALLFADAGLSGLQIASLFATWSVVGVLAEVPSGALADRISRRHLLTAAPVLRAAGFLLWVLAPSYEAFVAGFVLWGLGGSLTSGTFEAYGYDELDRMGAVDRYPALRARTGAVEPLAVVLATLSAAPLLSIGGYALLGVVSAAGALAQVALATTLPLGRPPGADEHESYLAVLRAGVREAVRSRAVRRLVLVAAGLTALLGVDEFIPLLLRTAGNSDAMVAVLYVSVPVATTAGMLAAERLADRSRVTTGLLLAAASLVTIASVTLGLLAGILALAVWYGVLNLAVVGTDIRLQNTIEGTARATVTSVGGVGAELAQIMVFLVYGTVLQESGSSDAAVTWLLLLGAALPTVLLAAATARSSRVVGG